MSKDKDSLQSDLLELYRQQSQLFRDRWNRMLPFSEMLIDRWGKAESLGFGEGASIYDNSLVLGDVKVGKETWIGPFTVLDGSGAELTIGDYCSVSTGSQIYTHDSVKWALSGGKAAYESAPTTIGNCVYIGPHAVIAKGVTIGKHSVIGAMSLVNKDIPDYSVAWGRPAQIVGAVKFNENGEPEIKYFRK